MFCIFYFHRANWHSSAILIDVFLYFSSVVRQMPGYNSPRRGTARTLPNYIVNCVVLVVNCVVLFDCIVLVNCVVLLLILLFYC
jgi:uncharacterized protein with PQ loop repeat